MRELILRGAFRPGERLREVPLSSRLNVSRTPLRLVLDRLAPQPPADIEFFARYIDLNGRFHALILDLAKSAMLSRSMEHVLTLPFASPNAFFLTETETPEGRETIVLSQAHHRAIANAI